MREAPQAAEAFKASPPAPAVLKVVEAAFDLTASRPGELSIKAGEKLDVHCQVDENW